MVQIFFPAKRNSLNSPIDTDSIDVRIGFPSDEPLHSPGGKLFPQGEDSDY